MCRLALPLYAKTSAEAEISFENPNEGEDKTVYRILIVEDDPVIAGAMCRQIGLWGFEVKCAEDFRDITGEFKDYDPHLVLLDIMLPFYDGYYWCSEIRKFSKVPIVFLSSASDNMNIVMAMNMGGDDFIAKPFDLNVLTAKIQAVLRRTYDFAPEMAQSGGGNVFASEAAKPDGRGMSALKTAEFDSGDASAPGMAKSGGGVSALKTTGSDSGNAGAPGMTRPGSGDMSESGMKHPGADASGLEQAPRGISWSSGPAAAVLEHKGAVLNTSDASLSFQGKRVELTKNEYRILQTLLAEKGRIVSRDKLMLRLWETDSFVDENTLTVNITRLRRKLEREGLDDFITTRKGLGYMIRE